MTTKLRWGFKSKSQLPLFMIWREYLDEDGEVVFAQVLINTSRWLPEFVIFRRG